MPNIRKIGLLCLGLWPNKARASFSCQICHVIVLVEYYGLAMLTSSWLVNTILLKTPKVITIYMSEPRFHAEKWRNF